jgi:hypothetical protein
MLYMPINPLEFFPAPDRKYSAIAALSRPGVGTSEARRQIPSNSSVNMIRDFSSGILKQLPKVVKMEENIG